MACASWPSTSGTSPLDRPPDGDSAPRGVPGTSTLAGALCGDWPVLNEAAGGREESVAAARAHLTRCLQPSPYADE